MNIKDKIEEANKLYIDGKIRDAFDKYIILAEEGITSAQRFVGWMYFLGEGTDKDLSHALRWFSKAAESDDDEAVYGCARIYLKNKEYELAREYLNKGEKIDYPPSIFRLGLLYMNGLGVEKNGEKAYQYFSKSAGLGHIMSKRMKAKMLLNGIKGIPAVLLGMYLLVIVSFEAFIVAIKNKNDPRLLN